MTGSALPPSGAQVLLEHGDQRAVVVEVGGGLRTYSVGGVEVLDGYGEREMVSAARGLPLIPWPNRLHGGSYSWDGRRIPVPQDEPEKGNALHGLTRFRSWTATDATGSAVTMTLLLHPSPPYPFALDLAVRYALADDGLTVTTSATNVGTDAAPYAQGAHPYVTVGEPVDDALLTVPADTWLPTDDNQIPTGRLPVDGSAYDFRTPRRIGELEIDYAFTDLLRGADGRARLLLSGAERSVEVWVDEGYPYLEVFTGDTVPDEARRRRGLGVEPMTAPPNAFVTGEDLVRLEPGGTVTRTWGIRARLG
ncbi:MAG: aldose 1-epimerase family protein [Actinobacteria bacterium]|nr:aldose 1-epimerase family protein [Actinomycetota bacterium]MCA1721525.1 aldose 1-epimerase family protein [Actinomycetota bacterium]